MCIRDRDHPDLLPTAEHLENPASFIDGLLDDNPDEGFEAEFSKLEEMLRQQDAGDDTSDNTSDSAGEDTDADGGEDKEDGPEEEN